MKTDISLDFDMDDDSTADETDLDDVLQITPPGRR